MQHSNTGTSTTSADSNKFYSIILIILNRLVQPELSLRKLIRINKLIYPDKFYLSLCACANVVSMLHAVSLLSLDEVHLVIYAL